MSARLSTRARILNRRRSDAFAGRARFPDAALALTDGATGLRLVSAAALASAAAVAVASSSRPSHVVAVLAAAAAVAVLGSDAVLCGALLAATGLLPFVNPEAKIGRFPVWLVGFMIAGGLMLLTSAAARTRGDRTWPLQRSAVLFFTIVLMAYTTLRLSVGSPLAVPSLSAPFVAFPLAALITYLWLSDPQATITLRRILPIILTVVAVWSLAFIGGTAAGCSACRHLVGTFQVGQGLGGSARLYTYGAGTLYGVALVLLGYTLYRPSWTLTALTGIAYLAVILTYTRAAYLAVGAGTVVLMIWRLRRMRPVAAALFALFAGIAVFALASSPVGSRGLSAYSDFQHNSGNVGYRLALIQNYSRNWSLLGSGVSRSVVTPGPSSEPAFNADLGIPNTVLILGFAGAALQLAVLGLAWLRGITARTTLGISLAAVCTMLIIARPSLPLIELGSNAVAYGVAVGFVAALWRVLDSGERSRRVDRRPVTNR
jgi:hypothetical protein